MHTPVFSSADSQEETNDENEAEEEEDALHVLNNSSDIMERGERSCRQKGGERERASVQVKKRKRERERERQLPITRQGIHTYSHWCIHTDTIHTYTRTHTQTFTHIHEPAAESEQVTGEVSS